MSFFEGRGIPAVALLSSGFMRQASFEANRLNMPGLVSIFVPHPISNCAPGEVAAKATDAVVAAILHGLEHQPSVEVESGEVDGVRDVGAACVS